MGKVLLELCGYYHVGNADTNESVAMADGTAGRVGLALAGYCSIETPVSVVLHTIST
jgi:hypothetical protein